MSQSRVAVLGGYKNRDFPSASPASPPQSGFPCEPGEFSASNSIFINWDVAVSAELERQSFKMIRSVDFGLFSELNYSKYQFYLLGREVFESGTVRRRRSQNVRLCFSKPQRESVN